MGPDSTPAPYNLLRFVIYPAPNVSTRFSVPYELHLTTTAVVVSGNMPVAAFVMGFASHPNVDCQPIRPPRDSELASSERRVLIVGGCGILFDRFPSQPAIRNQKVPYYWTMILYLLSHDINSRWFGFYPLRLTPSTIIYIITYF